MTLHRRAAHSPVDYKDTISTGLATPSRGAQQVFLARQVTRGGGEGPLHRHDVEEITLLLDGVAEVQIGDETVSMEAGDVLIVPPETLHQMRNPGGEPIEYLIAARAGAVHSLPDGEVKTPSWTN